MFLPLIISKFFFYLYTLIYSFSHKCVLNLCFCYRQVSDAITRIMNQKGIKMINNTEVVDASSKSSSQTSQSVLVSSDGKQIPYDHCFWCIQASAQGWLRDAGLAIDADGFVSVDATLQSINTPDVFAAGDVCHLVSSPRPKAGVFAVRAGPPLLDNIRRRLFGEPLLPWEPQTEFLGIIGTYGDGLSENSEYAVASKGPLALEGAYLWELKDRIDRNWMLGYQQLPSMSAMANANKESAGITNVLAAPVLQLDDVLRRTLEKASMRCGGCGSKVGSQVLTRALRRITSSIKVANKDGNGQQITSELGDDDAAICVPPPFPLLSVHTIDFFKTCYPDPYLFGQIAANHALSGKNHFIIYVIHQYSNFQLFFLI